MRVSSAWLKEWLRRTILDDQHIADALERAGMEVEQIIASRPIDGLIVVGMIKKVIQHPQADKLHIVQVTTGSKDLSIVCGAPNVREGMKVAVSQIGAVLPSGDKIQQAKLRGEVSEGMLCSQMELGQGNDHTGILEIAQDIELGTPLRELYPADAEINMSTPANRIDVLSVIGLAREVAAMTDAELVPVSFPEVKTQGKNTMISKNAEASRYMLARLSVDQSREIDKDMVAKLRVAGVRHVSSIVDITNYVMLEVGQPLHAFDASKVTIPIEVRGAKLGEKLTTLDSIERKLTPDDLIIADQKGPIALAGLMGGKNSEIDANTREILLEAAVFDGATVRKMAKRHGLRTEASARFERSLPVQLAAEGMARAVQLLKSVAGAKVLEVDDQQNALPLEQGIELNIPFLSSLVGMEISANEAVQALGKLEIRARVADGNISVPEVPWWRTDLKIPEDLVEEIVRVIGYDKIPSTIPAWRPKRLLFDRERSKRRKARDVLFAAGLFEVMTYSFVSEDQLLSLDHELSKHLKIKNPLSSEQAYLRSTLLASHLTVLERNRTYSKTVGFYELSNVFIKRDGDDLPEEPTRMGVTMLQPAGALAQAKGVLDALASELNVQLTVEANTDTSFDNGRSGTILLGDMVVGRIGQVRQQLTRALKLEGEVAHVELDFAPVANASTVRQYAAFSRFPAITRGLAIAVPLKTSWRDVAELVNKYPVEFAGDYYGPGLPEGFKGMTLRITMSNPDRTPTEPEAAELEDRVMRLLERKVGAKPRD
jgi:phenylalanyl-tRNA synthetase beta chain